MFLDEIIAYKKDRVKEQKQKKSLRVLEEEMQCAPLHRNFVKALRQSSCGSRDEVKIIAEIKKASPSKGVIRKDVVPADVARLYQEGGADAISVLTEDKYFMGCDAFLQEVKQAVSCPVLRKDFIIDPYQIYQSKALGADAVLLIVAVLGKKLKEFYNLAKSLELECLVEVHDEKELEIALDCGVEIIGINNRDLKSFTVSLDTTQKLISMIPEHIVKVSESGIKSLEDIRCLKSIGVDAFLIGETLMTANDVVGTLRRFKGIP
ncbi:indole-3-glycerol phosphate synthase [Caldicoprobacter guelmensis]|uniref:indole-3-glycerol phosphate synthase TrpC n=1 Tax=Caldicoprobacter guelmensis TaxID=1170224 RepID=UPI001957077C|nr:indole-3-glycerol phosphate synthase TrpC [Caldicoprobacter guelmensis]MBM7582008.1 indole-3-glycerol phosphate synthase [Caldicoprobacter guelmensis]